MKPTDELVFSNDLCAAFLTAIVRSFARQLPRGFLGRTAMQKLAYFSKVLGAPIPCSYEIYTYGPYSDRVTFSVDSLLADDVLTDRSSEPKYSNYRLGPNADRLLEQYDREIQPYVNMIDRIVGALGDFQPRQLELLATLHFINERLRKIKGRSPTKDEVIQSFLDVKGHKFSRPEIDECFDALKSTAVIS